MCSVQWTRCSERNTSKFWLWNLDSKFLYILAVGHFEFHHCSMLMHYKSYWAFLTLMLIHHLSYFQKLKSMDSKTVRKSKWTLKTKIVIVRIPMIPSNSTKSLILLPLNSTKSLISNNSNLNRIYYPKKKC